MLGYTEGVFWLIIVMATGMVVCAFMIDNDEIDHDVARGGTKAPAVGEHQPSGFMTLLSVRDC